MKETRFLQIKWYFVGFVTLTIWSMLIWQYLHEGVPSHHLLQRADLPAITNWWGGILLPVLSWVMLGRILKRILQTSLAKAPLVSKQIFISFVLSLIYGAMLSFTFFNDYSDVSSMMFSGILFFSIFFRVYRAEFILGFILSMSFAFGAVLPTIFSAIITLASAVVYFSVQFIWSRLKMITTTRQVN